MKMRILAASAAALLCATGVAMAQDAPGAAVQSPGAPAGGGTLCSTLNAISPDMKQAFLQGYSAGRLDVGGGAVDTTTTGAIGQPPAPGDNAANGVQEPAPLNPGAPNAMAPATPGAGGPGDLAANNAVTSGGAAAPAAGTAVGTDMDWSTVIASCTSSPTSPISGYLSGIGAAPPAAPAAPAQ